MMIKSKNNFDLNRLGNYLANLNIDQLVGMSGLGIFSAASLLAFIPATGTLAVALSGFLSSLGLNVFSGLIQQEYSSLLNQPSEDEQKRLLVLSNSLSKDIKRNANLRREIGSFLVSFDAFDIAQQILNGNPAVQGWLLAQIYKEITEYHTDFKEIQNSLSELKQYHELADLSFEVNEFRTDYDGYYCNLRLYNGLTIGKTSILTKIFLQVREIHEHDRQIPKIFYGAPIGGLKIKETVFIPAKDGKWILLDQNRKYPPNEVEDISFRFKIQEGWHYVIRFGVAWYVIGDTSQRKTYSPSYIIGEPKTDTSDQDEYALVESFVDKPVLLPNQNG